MLLLLGLFNYILRRQLALTLPENDFGFLYSAMALIMLLMGFLDLGLGEAMGILISRSYVLGDVHKTKKLFTCFLYLRMTLAVICFCGLAMAAHWLKVAFFGYSGPIVLMIGLFVLIITMSLESAVSRSLAAIRAFTVQYAICNLRILLLYLLSLLFVPKFGLAAMVIAWPTVGLVTAGLGALYLNRKKVASIATFSNDHYLELKAVLSISMWIAVATAGTSAMLYMDTLCLTWLKSLADVAIYNVVTALNQMVYSLMVLPIILTPTVSILWAKKDYKEIRRINLYIICFFLLALPVTLLVGIFWAADIITIMFDEKYARGSTALIWLWAGTIFLAIGNVCTRTLNAGHSQRSVAGIVILCAVINFILNVLLIPPYGIVGAAAATSMSYVFLAIVSSTKLFTNLGTLKDKSVIPSVQED